MMRYRRIRLIPTPILGMALACSVSAAGRRPKPVAVVAGQTFRISTAQGSALEPFIISVDWSRPQPQITRVVIIFHGKGRDVAGYYHTLQQAAGDAGPVARGTLLIAPQFLDEEDARGRKVPLDVLRWRGTEWESGAAAVAPIPLASYEVVDALLARLCDRSLFPALQTVVLAGHSGGGQLVQRYAVVGRAPPETERAGIHLRFVIANPSSYVYFSNERPGADGRLAPFRGNGCPDFNRWKYGTIAPPAYVNVDSQNSWRQIEAGFAQRDVIYLLGTADIDPGEKDLDVSCAGEAEGPTRLARGKAYYAYLQSRHLSGWNQRLWLVPGIAHSARQMFTSACGVAALFDSGACQDR